MQKHPLFLIKDLIKNLIRLFYYKIRKNIENNDGYHKEKHHDYGNFSTCLNSSLSKIKSQVEKLFTVNISLMHQSSLKIPN